MSETTQIHEKVAPALIDSEHADVIPDDVLAGWKCGLKMVPNSTENIVTVHENDNKDMAFAINEMESVGYEVVNVHFDSGVVEFMK
jgi:hypothetical protein